MMRNLAFVRYPEDWVGRHIVVFNDGAAMLSESLLGRERIEAGQQPRAAMTIEEGMTQQYIDGWLTANNSR